MVPCTGRSDASIHGILDQGAAVLDVLLFCLMVVRMWTRIKGGPDALDTPV